MPDAIRVLHDHWDLPRTAAAERARSDRRGDARRRLHRDRDHGHPTPRRPAHPARRTRTCGSSRRGRWPPPGTPPNIVARHLVAHAPTLDAFAAGLAADRRPRRRAHPRRPPRRHPDQLAAASEAYGLSPAETATVLAGAGTSPAVVLDTLTVRCDRDTTAAVAIATAAGITDSEIDAWRHPTPPAPVTAIRSGIDLDAASLLAALPPPGPAVETDPIRLLDTLTAGIEPAALEPTP